MEPNHKIFRSFTGSAYIILALLVGLGLGAGVHAIYVRTHEPKPASLSPTNVQPSDEAESPSEVAHISVAAQKDVGIAAEQAKVRSLQDMLEATGTVSEDPIRVAHIRPLARGIIVKSYVRLGDRVS